jgi:CRISPR type III-associated protein (TIGR04423 family)
MSEYYKKLEDLQDIPSLLYTGYYWLANETNARVLKNETLNLNNLTSSQILQEALLWNDEKQISIHITHKGKLNLMQYNLKDIDSSKIELIESSFLPHGLTGVKKINFVQIWETLVDENCENFPVKKSSGLIFKGLQF